MAGIAFGGGDVVRRQREKREVEAAACQSVGLAAHSVRACTRETIGALGAHATTKSDGRRVMHIHLEEQTKELAECAAANGGATPSEVRHA